jgi:pSer/pThr/pTyr-binding forkhead associated (FHA) protein
MKSKVEYKKTFACDEYDLIRVGRSVTNEVVIESKIISKVHMLILKQGEYWYIKNGGLEQGVLQIDKGGRKNTKNGIWLVLVPEKDNN